MQSSILIYKISLKKFPLIPDYLTFANNIVSQLWASITMCHELGKTKQKQISSVPYCKIFWKWTWLWAFWNFWSNLAICWRNELLGKGRQKIMTPFCVSQVSICTQDCMPLSHKIAFRLIKWRRLHNTESQGSINTFWLLNAGFIDFLHCSLT